MKESRSGRAKLNSLTTFANQIITTVCGIIIPRAMLKAFGSVLYGATTSISQFLSYITLLESGVGRAARAALYKPLADRDKVKISRVYNAIKNFFRIVAIIFILYVIVLAYFYYDIANIHDISRQYVSFLVIAISLSTIVDYLCGISNLTLLNSDQKKYVTNAAIIGTRILNTALVLILINLGSGILTVKLGSSIVIMLRPLFFSIYVKKHYDLPKVEKKDAVLPQKWTGLAQHAAYFVHSNTDVIILTVFADLSLVAVYSIYALVITSVRNVIISMVGGMEAELGDMYAKGEELELKKAYCRYHSIITVVSVFLIGLTALLIVPFVGIYTKGITDADYIRPRFAFLLIMGEMCNCLALPCTTISVSANRLKQTQWGSFGEAIINIFFSLVLMLWDPLLGVAVGTLIAEMFKLLYYSTYSEKKILNISCGKHMVIRLCAIAAVAVLGVAGGWIAQKLSMDSFYEWLIYAVVSAAAMLAVGLALLFIFKKELYNSMISMAVRLLGKRKRAELIEENHEETADSK
jgi:O-antigen/teichoic acid export membrane protein